MRNDNGLLTENEFSGKVIANKKSCSPFRERGRSQP